MPRNPLSESMLEKDQAMEIGVVEHICKALSENYSSSLRNSFCWSYALSGAKRNLQA